MTGPRESAGLDAAVKTYRYLRLAMVVLVVGIFAAITIVSLGGTTLNLQPSISHYYYTPARDMFVAALVAIGVCLFCVRGGTAAEDALLNIAGMLALIVALVPVSAGQVTAGPVGAGPAGATVVATEPAIPGPVVMGPITLAPGEPSPSLPADLLAREQAITTNFEAYLVVVGLAALLLVVITVLSLARRRSNEPSSFGDRFGFFVAVLIVAGFAWWFFHQREGFLDRAHNWAAIGMFGCISLVAIIDGVHAIWAQKALKRGLGYILTGLLMIGVAGGVTYYRRDHPISYGTLLIEASMIVLFAAFWAMQTLDLWGDVSRAQAIQRTKSEFGQAGPPAPHPTVLRRDPARPHRHRRDSSGTDHPGGYRSRL